VDQEKIVNSRAIHLRRSLLLRDVARWQDLRADQAAAAGDVSGGLTMKRQNLRVIDQYANAGASTAYEEIGTTIRVAAVAQMSTLANHHQDLLSAKELEEIEAWEVNARLAKKILQQAAVEMPSNKRKQPAWSRHEMLICAVIVGTSLSLAVILLLVGLATIGLSRVGKTAEDRRFGACPVAGCGICGHGCGLRTCAFKNYSRGSSSLDIDGPGRRHAAGVGVVDCLELAAPPGFQIQSSHDADLCVRAVHPVWIDIDHRSQQ
jgi:hypothetical protein